MPICTLSALDYIQDEKLTNPRPMSDCLQYINWLPQGKSWLVILPWLTYVLQGIFTAALVKPDAPSLKCLYMSSNENSPMILGDNAANHELFKKR